MLAGLSERRDVGQPRLFTPIDTTVTLKPDLQEQGMIDEGVRQDIEPSHSLDDITRLLSPSFGGHCYIRPVPCSSVSGLLSPAAIASPFPPKSARPSETPRQDGPPQDAYLIRIKKYACSHRSTSALKHDAAAVPRWHARSARTCRKPSHAAASHMPLQGLLLAAPIRALPFTEHRQPQRFERLCLLADVCRSPFGELGG